MPFAIAKTISISARLRARAITGLLLGAAILSGCGAGLDSAEKEAEAEAPVALETQRLPAPTAAPPSATGTGAGEHDHRPLLLATDDAVSPAEPSSVYHDGTPTTTVASPGSAPGEAATHTVRPGDTLSRIAAQYDVSMRALLNANDLPNPDFLEVGQVINLPQTPLEYTAPFRILPDSRLVRSIGAAGFDTEEFVAAQPGRLHRMKVTVPTRQADGRPISEQLSAGQAIERVSQEFSVDARVLLAFLEHAAGLLSDPAVDEERLLNPLLSPEDAPNARREGLYAQASWLADQLNKGYYDWKYRGKTILDAPDGSRLYFDPNLNAGSIAVQFALAQFADGEAWQAGIGESGLRETYRRLFGDPFEEAFETVPSDLRQPELTLPFPRGDVWRFTGGFHGGWGNGSAWAAVDFAPPDEVDNRWCYTSSFPITAIARGMIVRLGAGVLVLDLDEDGNDGTGWTIVYLHLSPHDALRAGQIVEAGNLLGYASCLGGYSTATHLHIARRYNGEWIPADCNRCPEGAAIPPFVMSNWKVVGLESQLYQGFMVNMLDNRSVIAEQGRITDVNIIFW
ncbi:MAG: LysM peptidoglycan-binding domain-containing M23 family metallopeptidase [Chloroflexota bacterium]|nr:LysM peptidoglycan-binding domain-containing M23 family metallopeptidase [Chloroflexota bacterium]